ncbi:YhdP family protein [Pseudoxanthomonas sp. PXM02]|uniref:YhdP family protein n=1 Tax=Pseudoxanthomonas sp. PXM02 TaxID=2769294 RepID=UPI0017834901|nr:YhdP family protein [Pseudoxanthomonas sp. PXM02]MBD9479757.1 TIGR02099 family protein [Pseudoxanthomonas sp. PXM02]
MPTPLRRRLRLARRGAVYGIAVVLVCMAVVLGIASQVLPLAERHPDRIAAWLSERAGRPVAFDAVKTQWTRRGPLLQLDGLRLGEGDNGVRIGQAEVLVSMYGGLLPGRSFTELRLRGLSLTLQRGDDGKWAVRGLPGQQQASGDPLQSLEGLGELQVIDGKLAIVAPSLGWDIRLPEIDLRLRVQGDRVRAGTRAWIRKDAAPLNVAVDFDRKAGDGRAYLDVSAEDIGAWAPLLRYAGVVAERGNGRVQAWTELRQHRVVLVTADARLRQVGLRGAPLPDSAAPTRIAFEQMEGRMRWRLVSGGWRLDAPHLRVGTAPAVQTLDGLVLAGGERYAVLADQVDAAPLFAVLGLSDKVDAGLRRWLVQAQPGARLARLTLAGRKDGTLHAEGQLRDIAFKAVGDAPGLSGLSGDFDGDAAGFRLSLDPTADMRFDWPSGFAVVHDVRLQGDILGWREGDGWRVGTSALHVQGKEYAADVRGGMWFQGDGTRPWIDLAANLADAPVPVAKGFWIHHKMPKAAVDWLNAALVGGTVRNGRAIVSGDLDDWPFTDHNGRFEAVAHIERGQFKFQPAWPQLEQVDADIAFIGNGFELKGRGALGEVAIPAFQAGIADFGAGDLKIAARTDTDAGRLLALLRRSPLHATYGETLDHLQAKGPVSATFDLLQPLHADEQARKKLAGTVDLKGARLSETRWDLVFDNVRGKAKYDDGGFASGPLQVVYEGQDGVLGLRAGSGTRDRNQAFEADLAAVVDADRLLDRAPEMAWLKPYMEGRSQWTVGVTIPRSPAGAVSPPTQLSLTSDLVGTAMSLPAPMRKSPGTPLATTVRAPLPMGSGEIDVAFGDLLALRARNSNGQTGVRVVLGSDGVKDAPPASGLVATGRAGTLDAMEWVAVARGGGEGDGLPLRHIDVTAERLLMIGSVFPDTRLQLAPAQQALAVSLDGDALSGALLVPDAKGAPIAGKLARLHWRKATPSGATATDNAARSATDDIDPAAVPPLSLEVEDLRFGDARLGTAKLRTRQQADGMYVDQLQLRSPGQQIDVHGQWTGTGDAARTRFAAEVKSENFGVLFDDLGLGDRVGGGHGQITAEAGWPGSPATFRLAALDGSVKLAVRDGHLLEVEPGAGRVLGLLSVAEVRRRLMLDFSDFFAKGFAFNRIDGDIRIDGGLARSDNLMIDGPAAEIAIRGDTDLRSERFDQTVDVKPKSANVLTAVGAVAAGPIGAAVGAVANAVLKKPLAEMGAKTYRVTGPWKSPKVEVVGREQSRARNDDKDTDRAGAP